MKIRNNILSPPIFSGILALTAFSQDFSEQIIKDRQPDIPQEYSSTSSSRQFEVRGVDAGLNNAISTKSDQIRQSLYSILKIKDEWKYPISIKLFGVPGEPSPSRPIQTNITLIDKNPAFSINIHIGKGIKIEELEHVIISTLLYEIALRKLDPDSLPEKVLLPPWILYGIEQAILWKSEHSNRNAYAALFERDIIMQPEETLSYTNPEQELDATTMSAYKISCGAMVMCLISQKGGEDGMMRVLNESLLGSDDPLNLIKRNFPLLTLTTNSLHKWWTLQLSSMATPPMTEALSIPETEQRLKEALTLFQYNHQKRISEPVGFSEIDKILQSEELKKQLYETSSALVRLSNRCFPAYRPIIVEYSKIILSIQINKYQAEKSKKTLANLVTLRNRLVAVATRGRDYLDWYEFNSNSNLSNTFDSYLNTVQYLRENRKTLNTPISSYLKDIEKFHIR